MLLPGHHVHLGSSGHHHHFFAGSHDHDEVGGQQSADHDSHRGSRHEDEQHASAHGDSAREGQGGQPEPSPEESSSPGLIDGFSVYTPSAASLTAFLLVEESVGPGSQAPAIASNSRLPGGARAPPQPLFVLT